VVHLVGEPGIGKTALAEHAAMTASGQGWTVVWGRAWDADAAPPYWLWQQALGSLARATDLSTRLHPATVAWLADLVPELAGAGEVQPAPALDPDRARVALHRAVVHVLLPTRLLQRLQRRADPRGRRARLAASLVACLLSDRTQPGRARALVSCRQVIRQARGRGPRGRACWTGCGMPFRAAATLGCLDSWRIIPT
jgi:AAA ATPase domain